MAAGVESVVQQRRRSADKESEDLEAGRWTMDKVKHLELEAEAEAETEKSAEQSTVQYSTQSGLILAAAGDIHYDPIVPYSSFFPSVRGLLLLFANILVARNEDGAKTTRKVESPVGTPIAIFIPTGSSYHRAKDNRTIGQ